MRTFRSPEALPEKTAEAALSVQPGVTRRFRRFAVLAIVCLFVSCARQLMAIDTNTPVGYLQNIFQQTNKRYQTETNSADAAWEFGRSCFDISTLQKDSAAQARYAEKGI